MSNKEGKITGRNQNKISAMNLMKTKYISQLATLEEKCRFMQNNFNGVSCLKYCKQGYQIDT